MYVVVMRLCSVVVSRACGVGVVIVSSDVDGAMVDALFGGGIADWGDVSV